MRAYFAGLSVRLQSDDPIEDTWLRDEDYLPRSVGMMPDGSLAVELTRSEAFHLAFKEPMVHALISATLRSLIAADCFGSPHANGAIIGYAR